MHKTMCRYRNINMKSTINTIATMITPDFISVAMGGLHFRY